MIFFQPGDSGINAMLGQIMWFKRFCRGYGLDFDIAFDLDQSRRNTVTESIHELIFSGNVKENINRSFDEVIGLSIFFQRVLDGEKFLRRDILVLGGINRETGEPGLWRFHAFQLHCLDMGFLLDRFPYWYVDLRDYTEQGMLAKQGLVTMPSNDSLRHGTSCFAHMRLGDTVVITRNEIEILTGYTISGDVLAADRMMTEMEFELYRLGLNEKFSQRHYAERGARGVRVSVFAQAIESLRRDCGPEASVLFSTDGYSRIARRLAAILGADPRQLEAEGLSL